jgi:protein AroM
LIGNKKLGVIVPLSEQQALNDDKFSKKGLKPIFSFASPYKHEEDEFIYAALSLKGKVDYILMDCMGYNEQMRHMIAQLSCVPTILSNALMAKMISEFI